MDVVIDGQRGIVTPATGDPFQAVFKSVRDRATASGRILVSLKLDGKELSMGRQEALGPEIPGASGVLEAQTADVAQFVRETLEELIRHCDNLEKAHERASSHVIAGKYQDALRELEGCFQGWSVLVRATLDLGALPPSGLRGATLDAAAMEARVKRVETALLSFRTAFEAKDVVRLGDVSQYELKPLLAEWRTLLADLRRPLS